jgi:MFS transporter, DHA2 family, methylenomycin A resistance protein
MALAAAVLGFFVITLDAVVVNVALPSIRSNFGGGITGLQWVVDGYTLMFAALLLWAGALSDRIGARRAFGLGLGVFIVASAACGMAPGLAALTVGRFVQGAAAAVMMPSSMALLGQAYRDPAKRARAIAVWAMGGAIAASAGPVLGGLLTMVSWRLIFFINIPVGAAAILLIARIAPSPRRPAPFNWLGQVTAVTAMASLTFGAIEAGAAGITARPVVVAFAAAVAAVAAFIATEVRGTHPMIPLQLFRSRNFSVTLAGGFAFVAGYFGLAFVMSLYLQQVRHVSPLATGITFAPMMVLGAALTPFSARLAERISARTLVVSGLLLMAAGLAGLSAAATTAPTWALSLIMVLVGLSGPLIMPPVTAVMLNSVPDRQAGVASGVFNTSRQLGGALAVAIFGALLAQPGQFTSGMRVSLLMAAGVALAAAGTSCLLRSPVHSLASTAARAAA